MKMYDRDKVIKGMELLYDRLLDAAKRDAIAMLDASMVANALALLKEQEPVKPKYTPKSIYSWECGVCAEPFDRNANYCPNCGRSVKWEC